MEFQKILSLKEFAGSFASLVCYSRIGSSNVLYAGGINLGLTLFMFGFPFLNPYLSTFMYFGPFWSLADMYALLASWIVAVCAQIAGACTAGTMYNYLTSRYGNENMLGNYKFVPLPDTSDTFIWLFDELFAVAFLLIGLLHLIRSLAEGILVNRFWKKRGSEHPPSHQALSVPLIICAVFLVVAITHAFPSANQSLHITIFLSVIGAQAADVCAYRSLGGLLGTMLALAYYHAYYNQAALYPDDGYTQIPSGIPTDNKPDGIIIPDDIQAAGAGHSEKEGGDTPRINPRPDSASARRDDRPTSKNTIPIPGDPDPSSRTPIPDDPGDVIDGGRGSGNTARLKPLPRIVSR